MQRQSLGNPRPSRTVCHGRSLVYPDLRLVLVRFAGSGVKILVRRGSTSTIAVPEPWIVARYRRATSRARRGHCQSAPATKVAVAMMSTASSSYGHARADAAQFGGDAVDLLEGGELE